MNPVKAYASHADTWKLIWPLEPTVTTLTTSFSPALIGDTVTLNSHTARAITSASGTAALATSQTTKSVDSLPQPGTFSALTLTATPDPSGLAVALAWDGADTEEWTVYRRPLAPITIINPNFDTDVAGWGTDYALGGWDWVAPGTAHMYQGGEAIVESDRWQFISRSASVGDRLVASVLASGSGAMGIRWGTQEDGAVMTSSTAWTEYAAVSPAAVAPDTSALIWVLSEDGQTGMGLDNFRVWATPTAEATPWTEVATVDAGQHAYRDVTAAPDTAYEYRILSTLSDGTQVCKTPTMNPTGFLVQFEVSTDNVVFSALTAPVPMDAFGDATYSYVPATEGIYHYRARFLGSDLYSASRSNVEIVEVWLTAPSATTLITDPVALVEIGSAVTLNGHTSADSGFMQFEYSDDAITYVPIGASIALDLNGDATTTDTPPALGIRHYRASYSGDPTHEPSVSNIRDITIILIQTVTTLTLNPSSVNIGGTTTLTADTSAPAGTIQFQYLNASTWTNHGGPVTVDANGVATTTYTFPTAGSISFRAQYSGSGNYEASISSTRTCTASKPTPTMNGYASPASITVGNGTTLVADTSATSGSVQFKYNSSSFGTTWTNLGGAVGVNATGDAQYWHVPGSTGTEEYRAYYLGDANWNAVTSSTFTCAVNSRPETSGIIYGPGTGNSFWCLSTRTNAYGGIVDFPTGLEVYVRSFQLCCAGGGEGQSAWAACHADPYIGGWSANDVYLPGATWGSAGWRSFTVSAGGTYIGNGDQGIGAWFGAEGCPSQYKSVPGGGFDRIGWNEVSYWCYTGRSLQENEVNFKIHDMVQDGEGNILAERIINKETGELIAENGDIALLDTRISEAAARKAAENAAQILY